MRDNQVRGDPGTGLSSSVAKGEDGICRCRCCSRPEITTRFFYLAKSTAYPGISGCKVRMFQVYSVHTVENNLALEFYGGGNNNSNNNNKPPR